MKPITIVLIGIGGYGNFYVRSLLDNKGVCNFKIAGAVDPYPEGCQRLHELKELNTPIFSSMEEFYSKGDVDLAIISTPIQYHTEQICYSLNRDSHVLCEKPLCATIEEAKEIIKIEKSKNKIVAIGYQWSFSEAIQELKHDIISGKFGKPKRLKTLVLWPRDFAYYNRNSWAGRKQDSAGNWVLDSVAGNATAHFLHNMFYLLGKEINQSTHPALVLAELYRANKIENYDTAFVRVMTTENVELFFYATHAVEERVGPKFYFEFEKASVIYNQNSDNKEIIAIFNNGEKKIYGDPFKNKDSKLWSTLNTVSEGGKTVCGPQASLAQVICINKMQESAPEITNFPDNLIIPVSKNGEKVAIYVEGLKYDMEYCYDSWKLPHELGISWSRAGRIVSNKL